MNSLRVAFAAATCAITCALAASLPPPKYEEWSTEKEIFVPMRDGVHLSTDLMRPQGAQGKLPTVLIRTPYDKAGDAVTESLAGLYLEQGYAVVVQSERGRYFSEGEYRNYLQGASTDGYDTAEWIVKQPWSNGKIGTFGCSSPGETQWLMAAAAHPAHRAMIPAGTWAVGNVPDNDTRGAFYRGGVPMSGFWAWWYSDHAPSERLLLPPNTTQEERIRLRESYSLQPKSLLYDASSETIGWEQALHLLSQDILRQAGGALTAFERYITWTPGDSRWNEVKHIGAGVKPRVPALHVSTWYDPAVVETTRLFKYLQDLGTPNQHLIIAAQAHCAMFFEGLSHLTVPQLRSIPSLAGQKIADLTYIPDLAHLKIGDLDIGDARYGGADHGWSRLFLSWLDYWVKGEPNGVTNMPKVQLQVIGGEWLYGNEWPLEHTRYTKYYLSQDPSSGLDDGAGVLTTALPARPGTARYRYDPGAPTPSRGGGCCSAAAALDQRPIEARRDVLVYSSAPLEAPITIAGPIEVILYVSSSAKDTDFMVKLVDVYPDGKAINLTEDAFRVRYREGFDKKVLMQPGRVYEIKLTNLATAVRFDKGHRIRLDIASSNFPLYERNLNTGGNNYDETGWIVAENTIHAGSRHPSRIVLPVLP